MKTLLFVLCCIIGVSLGTAIWRSDFAREVHAQAVIIPGTQPDTTGDGAAHAVGIGTARWVQVIALAANGAAIRCANSTASATRGAPIAAGGGFLFPPSINQNLLYDLSNIYCYAANGDKFALIWGN